MNKNPALIVVLGLFIVFGAFGHGALAQTLEDDPILDTILEKEGTIKPYTNLNYDYQSTKEIPVKIFIKERIKSELDVYEGQEVSFIANNNVKYKNRIVISEGTLIKARVGTVIKNGMNGIPASIIFDSFEIPGVKKEQISDTVEIHGQDRSLLVFPLKWALTLLPPTGSLTNLIKGGHVKLNTGKLLKLYYYPEWQ